MYADDSLRDAEDLFFLGQLRRQTKESPPPPEWWDEDWDDDFEDDDCLYPRDGTIPWVYPVREKRA